MGKRYINPVTDNYDKQNTYAELLDKYNLALKHGFYFEAMLIDYALLEDRLRSYMYHMGALFNTKSYKANKGKAPAFLRDIVSEWKKEDEKAGLNINSISGKEKILRAVLRWASEVEGIDKRQKYLWALKSQCESLDVQAVFDALDQLDEWREYRNEIIHALMNKNMLSLNTELEERVKEGMRLARFFDSQLRIFKKGNVVRKAANLPIEY